MSSLLRGKHRSSIKNIFGPNTRFNMTTKKPFRVLIFDDDESIREILWRYFNNRKYEVFTFPHPNSCPLSHSLSCPCPSSEACADIILSDLNMPFIKGIDFLEQQISKGCKCKHLALMSADLTEADSDRARAVGIKLFNKPFALEEIDAWVDEIEASIPPNRKLLDWFF